ncbi:MAG: beta-glucosidase [Methylotenera sp.]|nr:beta-glucosidase [Methylotenera sp.]
MIIKDNTDMLPQVERSDFVNDFRWGCATSAYQIEGSTNVDGRGTTIWDKFCEQAGTIRDGSSGAIACDHYNRWPQDLDLARELGLNSYRFSIAWSRIFPDGRGMANNKGLDFYSRLVDGLLERGIEPWPTLYHWDLPQALQEQGGWKNRDTATAFADFAHTVSHHLGDRVQHWITHNEPWCTAFLGHYEGIHAPGEKNIGAALQVCHHVLLSHGMAISAIRSNVANAKVGIALSLHPLKSASNQQADIDATIRHDGLRNRWFLDPLYGHGYPQDILPLFGKNTPIVKTGDMAIIATATDFLGVNYYFPETIANASNEGSLSTKVVEAEHVERTDFGWEVSPEGMTDLLTRITKDYNPPEIYITENGSTYDDVVTKDGQIADQKRRSYLVRHLAELKVAMASGVPLKGYFAWSLLDNFEWAEGYTRRFGLIHVDYATQQRRLKLSGEWYRDFLCPLQFCGDNYEAERLLSLINGMDNSGLTLI